MVKNLPAMQENWVRSLGWDDPLEEGWQPTPIFLACHGGSDGVESTCSVGDLGSIPGLGRSLEEGMATHSSILAWRIPMNRGATVHGGLQSMGS